MNMLTSTVVLVVSVASTEQVRIRRTSTKATALVVVSNVVSAPSIALSTKPFSASPTVASVSTVVCIASVVAVLLHRNIMLL